MSSSFVKILNHVPPGIENEHEVNLLGLETMGVNYTLTTKYKQDEILDLYIKGCNKTEHIEVCKFTFISFTFELLLRYLKYLHRHDKKKKIALRYQRVKKNDPLLKETCSICLDHYSRREGVRKSNCNHTFHKKCIDKWYKQNDSCPICRQDLFEKSTSEDIN